MGHEAAYHSVEEYMVHVEEYFDLMEVKSGLRISQRKVYVATDDPEVRSACRRKYGDKGYVWRSILHILED